MQAAKDLQPRYSGLRVQGTASSPLSTAVLFYPNFFKLASYFAEIFSNTLTFRNKFCIIDIERHRKDYDEGQVSQKMRFQRAAAAKGGNGVLRGIPFQSARGKGK